MFLNRDQAQAEEAEGKAIVDKALRENNERLARQANALRELVIKYAVDLALAQLKVRELEMR